LEPVVLPKRLRLRSVDRGLHFVTEAKVPILGPKTKEEVDEETSSMVRLEGCLKNYAANKASRAAMRNPVKEVEIKRWTPRWEDMPIDESDKILIQVQMFLDSMTVSYDLELRRGFEWLDFCFLVDSKMGK
jgi:hypothetical protein